MQKVAMTAISISAVIFSRV